MVSSDAHTTVRVDEPGRGTDIENLKFSLSFSLLWDELGGVRRDIVDGALVNGADDEEVGQAKAV